MRLLASMFISIVLLHGCSYTDYAADIPYSVLVRSKDLHFSDFIAVKGCRSDDELTSDQASELFGGEFVISTSVFTDDYSRRVTSLVTKNSDDSYTANWFVVEKCKLAVLKTEENFEPDFDYTWIGF